MSDAIKLTEVTLSEGITFPNDMPRKRFIHGHDGFEISVEAPFIWVQKVRYQDGTAPGTKRIREVVVERGAPMANVASVSRTPPPPMHVPEDDESAAAAARRSSPGQPAKARA